MIDNKTIYFAQINPNSKIPIKRQEDVGYDIFPCFEEEYIIIKPGEIKLIPTGIACGFCEDYGMIIKERSSTGIKGMSVRMGVIDSGYRGEIKVGINNTTNQDIIISKNPNHETGNNTKIHDYNKAIAQAVIIPVPKLNSIEIEYNKLLEIKSERGENGFGSTNN